MKKCPIQEISQPKGRRKLAVLWTARYNGGGTIVFALFGTGGESLPVP